jgi:hypothetical protein
MKRSEYTNDYVREWSHYVYHNVNHKKESEIEWKVKCKWKHWLWKRERESYIIVSESQWFTKDIRTNETQNTEIVRESKWMCTFQIERKRDIVNVIGKSQWMRILKYYWKVGRVWESLDGWLWC